MRLTQRLAVSLNQRTPGPLPFHITLTRGDARELLALAEYGEHALVAHACEECQCCVDCEDGQPTRCDHGHVLCTDDWPGHCSGCQAELAFDTERVTP